MNHRVPSQRFPLTARLALPAGALGSLLAVLAVAEPLPRAAPEEAGLSSRRLYTMTKPITSVALLTLYEQGKVQVSDPLDEYIPAMADLRVYTGTDSAGNLTTEPPRRKSTIHDIFRHTGGFSYGTGTSPVDRVYQRLGINNSRAASLKEMVEEKLPQAPLVYQAIE